MSDLRVVVIDDDRARREKIANILPEYIDTSVAASGDEALKYIRRDGEGRLPDVVILNGEDTKSFGLYVFDWMVNKSRDEEIAAIPVIVLTDDEYSDKSLEFFEIGDVTFYEGEIEDDRLFSMIMEAIEEAEFAEEPVEASYEETKSIDRLIGLSVKAPGGEGKQRAVVLDMDTRLKNLEAALERGQKRVRDIRSLIGAAQKYKSDSFDDEFELHRRNRKHGSAAGNDHSDGKKQSYFKKSLIKAEEKDSKIGELVEKMQKEAHLSHTGPEKRLEANAQMDVARTVDILKQKAMNNPFGAMGAQGSIKVDDRPRYPKSTPSPSVNKKTVVIVDSDVKATKLYSLFLTQKYNVVTLDSGIKTIDYAIRNHIDLLIINPILPGMSGAATISSVRMQPGGANIPLMYLVGDDYTQSRSKLLGPNVYGILNKPLKKATLVQSVDGFFSNWQDV